MISCHRIKLFIVFPLLVVTAGCADETPAKEPPPKPSSRERRVTLLKEMDTVVSYAAYCDQEKVDDYIFWVKGGRAYAEDLRRMDGTQNLGHSELLQFVLDSLSEISKSQLYPFKDSKSEVKHEKGMKMTIGMTPAVKCLSSFTIIVNKLKVEKQVNHQDTLEMYYGISNAHYEVNRHNTLRRLLQLADDEVQYLRQRKKVEPKPYRSF